MYSRDGRQCQRGHRQWAWDRNKGGEGDMILSTRDFKMAEECTCSIYKIHYNQCGWHAS